MARSAEPEDPAGRVWDALEAGDVERALELARALRPAPDDGDSALAIAVAHLEAGLLREARERLEAMEHLSLDGDLEFERVRHLAETCFLQGVPQRALDLLHRLEPVTRKERAALIWQRGLCWDLDGDRRRADECFREASKLDADEFPPPVPISAGEMEKIVKLACARLPAQLQQVIAMHVPVVIDDLPSLDLVRNSGGEVLPDILGLYTGPHLLERSVHESGHLPPQIFLYRRNLERLAVDRTELVHEIETTLLHELGHHLGYEEDDLDRMGLG